MKGNDFITALPAQFRGRCQFLILHQNGIITTGHPDGAQPEKVDLQKQAKYRNLIYDR